MTPSRTPTDSAPRHRTAPRRRGLAGAGLTLAMGVGTLSLPVGALTPASSAEDTTPGYSVRAIEVAVTVGPNNDIPCTVVGDVYTPDGVTATNKAPAVLTTNGFGGSKDNEEQRSYAQGFAMAGYVVLTYSGLGFGGSSCKIALDDPDYDGKAGKQMVSVLAGTKSYRDVASGATRTLRTVSQESAGDPRVGMIGGSYGGHIQYAIAMQDKRLDALIPMYTWNDLSYALAPNNTSLTQGVTYQTPGVHKRVWVNAFFAYGVANGFTEFQADPFALVPCPNFRDEVCDAKVQMEAQGYPDADTLALARHASISTYYDRVTTPTLVVQGQKDTLFNLQESVATYRALKARGVATKMIWQSFGHSNQGVPLPGEFDKTGTNVALTSTFLGKRFLAWMDHYVRGDATASTGPEFAYYRDWVPTDGPGSDAQDIAATYRSRSSFSQAIDRRFYLSGTDRLVGSAGAVQAGSASYANVLGTATSYSETSAVEGDTVDNPIFDTPGTYVSYTSAPLGQNLDVVGSPRLTLRVDAPVAAAAQSTDPAGQLVLFAKLYDVAPDGTPTLKNRLISPVRVTDVTKPFTVELPGIVHRFAAGHRLQVVIAASDVSYAGNDLEQPVTVTTSPGSPGVLALPLD